MVDLQPSPSRRSLPHRPHRMKLYSAPAAVQERATVKMPAARGEPQFKHGQFLDSRVQNEAATSHDGDSKPEEELPRPNSVSRQDTDPLHKMNGHGTQANGKLYGPTLRIPAIDTGRTASQFQFEKEDTIPMVVLRGIASQQGQPVASMQSEISGAAGDAAIVGAGNIAGNVLKYGSNFLIQRGFGPGPFGLYTLSLSLVTLLASIFNLGLDDAMLRYIPIYRARKQPRLLLGLVVFCTALAGAIGIIGALLVVFFAPLLVAFRHTPKEAPALTTTLQLMAPMVPLLSMQVVWFGGLQGFKAFKWRVLAQRFLPSIVLIMLLGFVMLFSRHLNDVVVATLIATVISTIISLYFLFRLVARSARVEPEQYEIREWLGFATPNFLTTITDTVMESIDTLLLAFYAVSSVGLGQYAAAIKISNFIALPLVSLNTMFAPTIAELHSKGEKHKLELMFKVVTKWTLALSLPIFGVATLFSMPLLAVSGKGFIAAWPLLIAFSIGGLINAGTGCVGYMLLMTGYQKLSFLNSVAGIIVNLVLGIILTPRFGAMGTAISTGLAVAVLNLARLFQVRVLLKMQPYRWDTLKPVAAYLISAVMVGVPLYFLNQAHMSLFIQLVFIPVFLALYVGILALFKLDPEDKIVVDKLRKKFLRFKK